MTATCEVCGKTYWGYWGKTIERRRRHRIRAERKRATARRAA